MAQTSTRITTFDVTPERLLEVISNPEFQEQQRKLDEAVVDSKFHEIVRTNERLVFELRSTEYERGMTGLNRKKTTASVTRVEWDLAKKRGTWTYSNPGYDRFSLRGGHRIESEGEKAKFVSETTVEVKVPLLGGKIEKAIIEGMTKGRERYDDLLRRFLKKDGGCMEDYL